MDDRMRELIYKVLPKRLRDEYAKISIGMHAERGRFVYDNDMIKQLHVDSFSQYGQDAFIYHLIFGGKTPQGGGIFWILEGMIRLILTTHIFLNRTVGGE